MKNEKNKSHGGKRENAGRVEEYPGGAVRTTITLSQQQLDWLDSQGRVRSHIIQRLIENAMKIEKAQK